jgi:hypothetical protein
MHVDTTCIMIHHHLSGNSMPARKVTPNSSDRLTITLDTVDRAALEKLSAATDRSLAWIVRDAVRQYLSGTKGQPGAETD